MKLAFCAVLFAVSTTALAQTVKLVVPFAAGGTADRTARVLERSLTAKLPYNFVIEYRTGAGGLIAANTVARITAKENVLLLHSTAIAINTFNPNANYDLSQDFVPVAKLGFAPMALIANPQRKLQSLKDLKGAADPMFYAAGGQGTAGHIAGELLAQALNRQLIPVWYKGESPAVTDVLNNTVGMMIVSISSVIGHANSGNLDFVAVTGRQRSPDLPNTATFEEQGIKVFDRSTNWLVLLANHSADAAVIKQIQTALSKIFADPADQALLRRAGIEPDPMPTAKVAEFLTEEVERVKPFSAKLAK
jgi:tripartite-type tricarboxylate transporter receptor subunit TctC